MRTFPDKKQAEELVRYFERRLTSRSLQEITEKQRENALHELKGINRWDEDLEQQIFDWSCKHIPSKLYSAAIRAVNKKLKRYADPSRKTTISIDNQLASSLESLSIVLNKNDSRKLTKNDTVQFLLQFYNETQSDSGPSFDEMRAFDARVERIIDELKRNQE